MEDERFEILKMVQEGKITAEEGVKLLEALEPDIDEGPVSPAARARWMRVRVTDTATGKPKVAVNLPLGILNWALRVGSKFASIGGVDLNGMGVNLEELGAALTQGFTGKFVDVVDEASGEHVEVIIE